MVLIEEIQKAHQKLMLKVLAFSEGYIFILEAQKVALANLKLRPKGKGDEEFEKTIQGSYLRLEEYLNKYEYDTSSYYRSILFIDLITSVELFFMEIIKAIITEYPHKVGNSKFELKDILSGVSVEEFIERSADELIHKLMYEKPTDYLEKICAVLSIDSKEIKPYWPQYVEAKARRDLGVHNNWICNDTYLRKTYINGEDAAYKIDDNLIPSDKDYCSSTDGNIMLLANVTLDLLTTKYS